MWGLGSLVLMTIDIILVDGFSSTHHRSPTKLYLSPSCRRSSSRLFASGRGYDNMKKDALKLLIWETLEESANRPVLNLSGIDDTPETNNPGTEDWNQGQLWEETKQGLLDRGMTDPETSLTSCPQLLRLAPSVVLDSADLVVQEYGLPYLESEPRLLTYRSEHIAYGLEFMSTMMMADAKVVCSLTPAFLLSGIDGGIQEQAVHSALGAAGAATSQANKRIAGDAMSALHILKQKKGL